MAEMVTSLFGGHRDQMARDIADLAGIYSSHEDCWAEWQASVGIAALDRGRPPESKFHPACRHLCELGGGDLPSRASIMATVLDVWERTGIAPAEIPAWIAGTPGGARAT